MTSFRTPTLTAAHHRERLLQERAQLLARMAQERGGLVSRADMAAEHDVRDFDDRAQAMTERDEAFAMNEHETAELGALDTALERLEAGHYGQCKDCGAPIPEDRLAAYPAALRCIRCQTAAEKPV
jgi:DnaK suppressor protein